MPTPQPPNLDEFVKRFQEAMPEGLQRVSQDMERGMKDAMQTAFSHMDLVTRKEFDVQAEVLIRTRTKLEALERRVAELEQRLGVTETDRTQAAKDQAEELAAD